MKKKEFIRALKFTFFSISAGIIQFASFALLNELCNLDYWVSYLISLVISVLYNFTINRRFTFQSANNVKVAMLLVLIFYLFFTPTSTYLEHVMTSNGINEYLTQGIIMISNFILEYLYNRFIVYRNSCDSYVSKKHSVE